MIFSPIHENLPTQDVHFGNILERYHFLCHKNVNPSPELVPMINSFMSLAGNKSDVMFTTMEHDRRIINIKFPFQREIPKGMKFFLLIDCFKIYLWGQKVHV